MSANYKADAAWDDYVSQQQEEKIEELERQLAAANERIKRLEGAVESLLPYAEATKDESSEWSPGWWKSEKLKWIINEARKAKEAKP